MIGEFDTEKDRTRERERERMRVMGRRAFEGNRSEQVLMKLPRSHQLYVNAIITTI